VSGSFSDVTNKKPLALRPHPLSGRLEGRPPAPRLPNLLALSVCFRNVSVVRGTATKRFGWAIEKERKLVLVQWPQSQPHADALPQRVVLRLGEAIA